MGYARFLMLNDLTHDFNDRGMTFDIWRLALRDTMECNGMIQQPCE